jgi:hypothetical protein
VSDQKAVHGRLRGQDDPLPREIAWILEQALNPVEAAHLLRLYRKHGINAAVEKGLWLNKNRSQTGRENWQEYNRRRRRNAGMNVPETAA